MLTETVEALELEQQPRRSRRVVLALVTLAGFLTVAVIAAVTLLRAGRPLVATPFTLNVMVVGDPESAAPRLEQATRELDRVRPKGVRIVIDTYQNRLRLVDNENVMRNAVCSTGTGIVLKDPRNGRQWIFDTPLGERTIERKVKNPIWAKPDWAFIEEGLLPPKDSSERFDNLSLGDYAMYMGEGYIIHGTLFKSLLGRRVTHGCVRLGDEDLEFIYKHAPIGTRVYLY
jgi:lipoprotein-anchoring transpeptidase ErfK/SrfK